MRRQFSASVFLVYEGRVLLVHHKRYDKLLPVGGELEEGERPIDCAIREVREETGIELDESAFPPSPVPGTPPGFIGYEEHDAGVRGLHMNFCFFARSPTKEVKLSSEHSSACWYSLEIGGSNDDVYNLENGNFGLDPTPSNVLYLLKLLQERELSDRATLADVE